MMHERHHAAESFVAGNKSACSVDRVDRPGHWHIRAPAQMRISRTSLFTDDFAGNKLLQSRCQKQLGFPISDRDKITRTRFGLDIFAGERRKRGNTSWSQAALIRSATVLESSSNIDIHRRWNRLLNPRPRCPRPPSS